MIISRDGFLFNFAYWFTDPHYRPKQINLCPFFWRLVLTALVKMPLWWLVWAPIGTVVGFLFAGRPKFFKTDNYTPNFGNWESPASCFTPYKNWHKLINKINSSWAVLLLPFFWFPIIAFISLVSTNLDIAYDMATILAVLGTFAGIMLGVIMSTKTANITTKYIMSTETAKVATEWVKAKKFRYCPIIEVK